MGDSLQEEKKRRKGLEFAERQLKRHGWSKGKGLGKLENGISEALRVKVKCDTAGVGHHSAEQFTFHWWDHLFNSSAASIAVEAGQDGVKVKKVSEQDGAITNKKPRKCRGDKKMLYGRFVKAATLTSGGEEPLKPLSSSDGSEEDEKLDLSTARRLTDEELVRACGGRTAHKGARHGFTMSAKLARLEEQEKAFLANSSRLEVPDASCRSPDENRKKAKKHKRGQGRELEAVALEGPGVAQEDEEPKKVRRKKRKQQDAHKCSKEAAEDCKHQS